jgi:hypothetical protein
MSRAEPALCFVFAVVVAWAARPAWSQSYAAQGGSALLVDADAGALVHTWSARCAAEAPADGAALVVTRELRFAADPAQVLAADPREVMAIDALPEGERRWEVTPGAYAFARLLVRCGDDVVFHEIVFDSTPVITAPVVQGPWSIVRTDDLSAVAPDAVPVGVDVELTGLGVSAAPRGDDVVEVQLVGAGVENVLVFDAGDFVDGHLALAPRLRPTVPGDVVVSAVLRGARSAPVTLVVVDAVELPGGGEPTTPSRTTAGCNATPIGGLSTTLLAALCAMAFVARRPAPCRRRR